ncbi:MAG: hypothetical protein SGCHY_003185 [Lobulomycetales sp.]
MKKTTAKASEESSESSSAYEESESDNISLSSGSEDVGRSQAATSKPSTRATAATGLRKQNNLGGGKKAAPGGTAGKKNGAIKLTLRDTPRLQLDATQQSYVLSAFAAMKIPNKEHYIMFGISRFPIDKNAVNGTQKTYRANPTSFEGKEEDGVTARRRSIQKATQPRRAMNGVLVVGPPAKIKVRVQDDASRRVSPKDKLNQYWQRLQSMRIGMIVNLQSLTYLREEYSRYTSENERLQKEFKETKTKVNGIISDKLDENQKLEEEAAKLFDEYVELERKTRADLEECEENCQYLLQEWVDKHDEKVAAGKKFMKDYQVLMEFKKNEDENPLINQNKIEDLRRKREEVEQEAERITAFVHTKAERELADIHDLMLLKIEWLGLYMGKKMSKHAKASTPIALAQRENKRIHREIDVHSQNQQSLTQSIEKLQSRRAELLQKIKKAMVAKVPVVRSASSPLARETIICEIGVGKEDRRRRLRIVFTAEIDSFNHLNDRRKLIVSGFLPSVDPFRSSPIRILDGLAKPSAEEQQNGITRDTWEEVDCTLRGLIGERIGDDLIGVYMEKECAFDQYTAIVKMIERINLGGEDDAELAMRNYKQTNGYGHIQPLENYLLKKIAANWKMNGNKALIDQMVDQLKDESWSSSTSVVLAPPAPYLALLQAKLPSTSKIIVCAQNIHAEPKGAFTGEVSTEILKDIGLSWTILGHSERRALFGESDQLIATKTVAALKAGLKVIFCCGETLEEREAGKTTAVVQRQLDALKQAGVSDWDSVVIAYEPVWAIGTGKVASPEQAQEVHVNIRAWVKDNMDSTTADKQMILYGGSVNAANCGALAAQPDIDGFLVGGASLKPEFLKICQSRD